MPDLRMHAGPSRDGQANITYEDVKRAADENGRSVEETLDIIARTADKDRGDHPAGVQPATTG